MNTTFEQFTLINEQTQTVERLRERQQADKDLTTFSDYEMLEAPYNTNVTPDPHTYAGFKFLEPTITGRVREDGSLTIDYYYDRISYTVVYDGNGATGGSMSTQQMTGAIPADLLRNKFSKTGSLFMGWNTEPDGSGDTYLDGQEVVNLALDDGATVTLYAQWTPNTYEVAFQPNGADGGEAMDNQSFLYDVTQALAAVELLYVTIQTF